MSRIFFAGHDRGAGQLPTLGFPRPAYGADTAPPFFYAYPGRGTQLRNSSYEFMETRRAQNTINYTDCTRPLLGDGRNRYDDSVTRLSGASVILPEKKKVGAAIVSYNFCSDLYSLVVAGYLTISFSASARLPYPFWEAS